MAVFNIPSRLWTAGAHSVGPASKPANALLVSFQVAAATDWVSGTAGRTVDLLVQSSPNGTDWSDKAEGSIVTPNMGKAGAFPTILEVDVTDDPTGTQYQAILTPSANLTCGWKITIA